MITPITVKHEPHLDAYTRERFVRELAELGMAQSWIDGAVARTVANGGCFSFTNYTSERGLICYCPHCDHIRFNSGPDGYEHLCKTCRKPTGGGNRTSVAVLRAPSVTSIIVKPLVWTSCHDAPSTYWRGKHETHSLFSIICEGEGTYRHTSLKGEMVTSVSLDAAKMAAQIEWSVFIQSAIEQPDPLVADRQKAEEYLRGELDNELLGPDGPPSCVRVADSEEELRKLYMRVSEVNPFDILHGGQS